MLWDDSDVSDSGAIFTFGKCKFNGDEPGKFWIKDDPVIDMACGEEHTVVILESGRVFSFGANAWGQLGLGHRNIQKSPTCIKSLKASKEFAVSAACGRNHTLIAGRSNRVFAFGSNSDGQLGCGDTAMDCADEPVRVLLDNASMVTLLSAGGDFSAALTADGDVYVWGSNSEGQLGLDLTQGHTDVTCPRRITFCRPDDSPSLPSPQFTHISCGHYHMAGVTNTYQLYTWGEAEGGKLGLGLATAADGGGGASDTPRRVAIGAEGESLAFRHVTCGHHHTVALSTDGRLYAWGAGPSGQLGLAVTRDSEGGPGDVPIPTQLPAGSANGHDNRFVYVCAGESHTAAISDQSILYTFGDNRHQKLGLNDCSEESVDRPTRVQRFNNMNVKDVRCGGSHTIVVAVPSDGVRSDSDVEMDSVRVAAVSVSASPVVSTTKARSRRRARQRNVAAANYSVETVAMTYPQGEQSDKPQCEGRIKSEHAQGDSPHKITAASRFQSVSQSVPEVKQGCTSSTSQDDHKSLSTGDIKNAAVSKKSRSCQIL